MQSSEKLFGELDRRCQPVPLGVDACASLFFRIAAQGDPSIQWALEQIEIGAVESSRQRRILGVRHLATVMKGDRVVAERLRTVLPSISDCLTELHVFGVQRVTFRLRVVEDWKSRFQSRIRMRQQQLMDAVVAGEGVWIAKVKRIAACRLQPPEKISADASAGHETNVFKPIERRRRETVALE